MILPNYKDGSIVNLMSSIIHSLGGKSQYGELKSLKASELKSKNTVLFVIDGLGYDFVMKHKDSAIRKFVRTNITSTFLSTTACGVMTFLKGTAPQQHGYTGWFMYIDKIEAVIRPLVEDTRINHLPLSAYGTGIQKLFPEKGIEYNIKAKMFEVTTKDIAKKTPKKSKKKMIAYSNLAGMFNLTRKSIKSGSQRKFIYSYWPYFDVDAHHHGTNGRICEKHFREIDKRFALFLKSIKGTDTTVILTADHGIINASKTRTIFLNDYPKLAECMSQPLCGEPRAVYCYVYPSKEKQFRKYARKYLGNKCWIYKSKELVKKHYFGLFKQNKELLSRVGDYILVMKKNYSMREMFEGEKPRRELGHHGSTSREEMLVPLVIVKQR